MKHKFKNILTDTNVFRVILEVNEHSINNE